MSSGLALEMQGAHGGRWKRYPAYRDSGVEWIGAVPEGWEIIRVKLLEGNDTSVVQTGPFGAQLHASDYLDDGVPLILIRNVRDLKIDETDIPRVSEEDAERLSMHRLNIGDIVFSRVGSIGRIALCTERENGWLISGQMLRLRIQNPVLDSRFSLYAFSSESVLTFVELQSVGSTRESINTDILRNMPIPIPPLSEQHAIAAFLDHEAAKIDALAAKKERLVERLEEKRTALISHAVIKGLDPDAPMKDSGIEWLGEVPEGWDVKRLKHVVSQIGSGKTPRGGSEVYSDSGIVFLRSQNVHFDGLHLDDIVYINESIDAEMVSTRVDLNDILLNITGASLGRCSVVPADFKPANVNQHVCIIRPITVQIDPQFLYNAVASNIIQAQIFSCENGTSREGLTFPQIANFVLSIPHLDEQRTIAAFLDRETAKIDALAKKIYEQIDKLKEYRTALISAAVTGKIDVHGEIP